MRISDWSSDVCSSDLVGAEVHRGQPLLSAELPETGERFEGILPTASPGPAFALRKRAIGVIPLERYVIDGLMTSAQAGFLVRAVREWQNVLIAGAPSSGKRSEEHMSELQSLMRISYAVFC